MYESQHDISKMYDYYSSFLTLMNNSIWGSNTMLNTLILVIQKGYVCYDILTDFSITETIKNVVLSQGTHLVE